MRHLGLVLLLAAWCAPAAAVDQPLLLPLPDLYRQLDGKQEWVVLPLADWKELQVRIAANGRDKPPVTAPEGAWIEHGTVQVAVVDDRELRCSATLTAVAVQDGPRRCPLFTVLPAQVGAPMIGGTPALLVPYDQGSGVLLPGPGRHTLTVTWTTALDGGDAGRRMGSLVLPRMAGCELSVRSAHPGLVAGGPFAQRPDGSWTLAGPVAPVIPFQWLPGRDREPLATVLGIRQSLQVQVAESGCQLAWSAELAVHRGPWPAHLDLRLPAGWRFTAHGQGINAIHDLPDGVRLALAPKVAAIACSGWCPAAAPIALPAIAQALVQGGRITLAGQRSPDYVLPPLWQVLDAQAGQRAFAVPGPDAGLRIHAADDDDRPTVRSVAILELGPEADRWRLLADLTIGGCDRFALTLRLPAGWRLLRFTGDGDVRLDGLAPGDEHHAAGTARTLPLTARAGFRAARRIRCELERLNPTVDTVEPLRVDEAWRSDGALVVRAGAGLATTIAAPTVWRLAEADAPDLASFTQGAGLRTALRASGDAAAVRIAATVRPPSCQAEAVIALQPGRDRTWCRCDLRLTISEGHGDTVELALPFTSTPNLTATPAQARWELTALGAGRWRLRSAQPWQGERLLRLEGPLAVGGRQPFPVPALTCAGAAVPLRLTAVLHAAADGDVVVDRSAGWRDGDVDDLPAWSGLIPGEPVVAVLRRQPTGPAEASWRVERHPLARLPGAFIDRLELATRIGIDGHRTCVRFLLAAPELQTLALGLPAGSRLIEATIDGEMVAPRRGGDDLHLPLPGRTQVQIALLYTAERTPHHLRLEPPRLGGLAVTRTAWQAGIDQDLAAFPVDDAAAMPMASTGQQWKRPWFGTWLPPEREWPANPFAIPSDREPSAARQAADPRALRPQERALPPRGEPTLELPTQRLTGQRLGGGAPLAITVIPGTDLRHADRLGLVLALLTALLLAWKGGTRVIAATIIAAPALACALHGWQVQGGPLLAGAEWCAPFLLGASGLWWLLRRLLATTGTVSAATAFAALLMAALAALLAAPPIFCGEAPAPVLMGYERLDEAGLPTGVRVALPRDRFTTLWNRAHPTPTATQPVCALATGAPFIELTAAPGRIAGALRLAFAVPGDAWQSLTLPLAPGLVRACAAAALGGAPVPAVAWRQDGQGLVLDLPPRSQGTVVVDLELPVAGRDGRWTATLPLPALPGGTVRARLDTAWRFTLDGRDGIPDGAETQRWDLPTTGGTAACLLTRAEAAAAAAAARLTIAQRLAVRLYADHLAWRAQVDGTGMGGRQTAIMLPEHLVLTAVEGDGLADWRQDGRRVVLHWRDTAEHRRLQLDGLIPRHGRDDAALALAVPGAVRSTGRLDLSHGAGARFTPLAHAALVRDHPAAGADLAWRWDDDAGDLTVRWQAEAVELRGTLQAAVLVGMDRVLCWRSVRLAGRGGVDALAWSLPAPWQPETVADLPATLTTTSGAGADRRAVLRSPRGVWRAGDTVHLLCSADRRTLGGRITLPEAVPDAGHLTHERARWLVGGAGDGGLRLADAAMLTAQPLAGAGTGLPAIFRFAAGERWLFAGLAGATPPVLVEEPVALRVEVAADHYLVLAQDRLRWWTRLAYTVSAGALGELRCRLPAGAQLTALRCRDLGSWVQEGDAVTVRLSAPARSAHVLELDLELPLAEGVAQVAPPTTPWGMRLSRVALVDEDGTGLVHLDPQGLVPADAGDAGGLPPGIAATAVPNRWRSERPAWTLGVRRETVNEAGGADGVVTLVDGHTALAPDGEMRSRALWHLLNRTRTRLALAIPAGVELWEVQVDGRPVRPREDAASTGTERTVHIPVTPLRPGAAATRIALTWRQAPVGGSRISLRPPRLTGLNVVQVAWRCTAPDGWRLERHSGSLEDAGDVAVANLKVQRVLDDVARLNRLGNLTDNGLRRQAEELAVLDQELNDHLTALEGLGAGLQAPRSPLLSSAKQQRDEVAKARAYNSGIHGSRATRRKQLQMDNQLLNWDLNQAPERVQDSLGPGQAPPGWRAAAGGALLGVELIPAQPGRTLALRGQGAELDVELTLRRAPRPLWPWLALLTGLVLAACAGLALRRREAA